MSSSVQDILDVLSPDAEKSLSFLAVPPYLDDGLAAGILVKSGLANGNAPELIEEIRSFPIWHEKSRTDWGLDDDVRDYVLSKLNGSAESTRRRVLTALREIERPSSPADSLHEFDLQLARLSLTVEQEQQSGIAVLRQFFNLHHDKTSRVVDLYIDESLPVEVPAGRRLPDHLHSAYFMRGHYAYKNKQFKTALRFLEPVWKRRSGSPESCHDAAIAAHLIGLMWSREFRRQRDAENAYRESLELGKADSHHKAQVWHSLGNLLSKNRQRGKEAEDAYRKSLELLERIGDQFGQAWVWHSFGNFLSKDKQRWTEAEEAYHKSLELEERNGNVAGQARAWHSLGNLFSKDKKQRWTEAEELYQKSLELLDGIGDQFGQAHVWRSLGNLLSKDKQRWTEAEELYQKSYAFLRKSGDQRDVARVSSSLGRLLRHKGDYEQAEHWLRISFEAQANDTDTFYRDKIAVLLEEVALKKAGR
ncbi:MAG: tetratricopeptide repeat protein [Candidatus Electrothrix sp. AU1_5]|nr:tetratricopeptide repeat protein [Candidatus Electrothrix gigas]